MLKLNNYSPLRYPGGKTKLYNYIRDLLEINNLIGGTYVEPFAGGAGLALKLLVNGDVNKIVINDLDKSIYSIWHSILNRPDDFCSLIDNAKLTISEWMHQRDIYRSEDYSDLLKYGFAAFYLNRTNRSGIINGGVFGGLKQTGNYKLNARFNKDTLIKKIQIIKKHRKSIILFCLDANDLINNSWLKYYRKVFINFDPPYVKKGLELYRNFFNEEDHKILSYNISKCKKKMDCDV